VVFGSLTFAPIFYNKPSFLRPSQINVDNVPLIGRDRERSEQKGRGALLVLHPAHRHAQERRIKNTNKLAVLCPKGRTNAERQRRCPERRSVTKSFEHKREQKLVP
jgi:hypothetical protein